MANEYFQPGSVPAPSSPGASAVIRNEFSAIGNAFDKLPILAGHANEMVSVNAAGTKLVTTGFLATDFITDDGVFTLTNKTIAWSSNTFPGFDRFATKTGTETLTNKTIAWSSNTFPGFGTGATKTAGTGANNVLLLSVANKLPALDGSLLTNIDQANIGTVQIAHGGTGATDLVGAQTNLGIDLKADAFDAVLTGAPTAPTPPTGDNSARIATTYFVTNTISAIGSFAPSNNTPKMNGTASAGVGVLGSRDDHVHPTDTSRAPLASPGLTGVPTAPTAAAGTNTNQLATTAFVVGQAGTANPVMNGTVAVGTSLKFAREDHKHPSDTLKANLASPTFTGTPAAPTPATSTNTTQIATTAFVQSLLAQQPPAGMQPSNTNPVMNGTASPGVGVEGSRYDHRHPSDTSRVAKAGDTMTGPLIVNANTTTDAVRITQIGTGNALVVEDSTNPDATPVVIDQNGKLIVGGPTALGSAVMQTVATTEASDILMRKTANSIAGPTMVAIKYRGTVGSEAIVANNDLLMEFLAQGYDGANQQSASRIQTFVDGTPAAGSIPGRLVFSTTPAGSAASVERMRINSNGEVSFNGADTVGFKYEFNGPFTGSTGARGAILQGTVQSDVTASFYGFRTVIATQAATFTLADLTHFSAGFSTRGAGNTITSMTGFSADSSIGSSGAVTAYGFKSDIAGGTNRFNFYAAGTADSFLGRRVLIGQDTGVTQFGATAIALQVNGSNGGYSQMSAVTWDAVASYGGALNLGLSKNAYGVFTTAAVNNDILGRIQFGGADTVALPTGAYIQAVAEDTWSPTSRPTRIAFFTAPAGATAPTEAMRIDSDNGVRFTSVVTKHQFPTNNTVSATLTTSMIRNGIISSTPAAAINLTLPTGTDLDASFIALATSQSFEWSVINLAAATHAITVLAGTGHTIVGSAIVAANTSGRFLTRKTGTNTFVTYRIA